MASGSTASVNNVVDNILCKGDRIVEDTNALDVSLQPDDDQGSAGLPFRADKRRSKEKSKTGLETGLQRAIFQRYSLYIVQKLYWTQ